MTVFKKGSLVPRRLSLALTVNKKAQHYVLFGVDVTFDGRTLKPINPMGEMDAIILMKAGVSAPRKNGTRQKSGIHIGSNWILSSYQNSLTGEWSAEFSKQ